MNHNSIYKFAGKHDLYMYFMYMINACTTCVVFLEKCVMIDYNNRKWTKKFSSWNVNGIRAWLKVHPFNNW